MIKNANKGFTLIELLVIIAIIGILASVVIISLGDSRSSARDAGDQLEASQLRAQSAVFYTKNKFSFEGFCDDGKVETILNEIKTGNNIKARCADNKANSTVDEFWVVAFALGRR